MLARRGSFITFELKVAGFCPLEIQKSPYPVIVNGRIDRIYVRYSIASITSSAADREAVVEGLVREHGWALDRPRSPLPPDLAALKDKAGATE